MKKRHWTAVHKDGATISRHHSLGGAILAARKVHASRFDLWLDVVWLS